MSDRLDSRALRPFLAVAETLSFRQAAEMLHVSQPPLSRTIRQMEERLGVRLFDRDTQGVALTPAGRRLLPHARRILAALAQAQAAVLAEPVPVRLRIGLTSAVEPRWFQAVVGALERQGRAAEVVHDASPALVRRLSRGALDAAFVALPTHAPDLVIDEIERQPLVAVLPAAHPLARRRVLSLAELGAEPLFWFRRSRQPAFFDHCRAVFERHGYAPPLRDEPRDHPVLLAAVAAGRGVALLPASLAALRREGVCHRPLREAGALYVGIGLATPPDRPAVRRLLLGLAGLPPRRADAGSPA